MKKSPAFQIDRGFKDFARASFGSGGDNLYVNARGVVETIHRTDINNDGFVDLVLPNSHGYIERGPTWIYAQADNETKWLRKELPNDSGWMSRVIDVEYKAFSVSPNGCHSPKLREVRLSHGENGAGISPEPSAIEGVRR